jgi:ubiquinone/menaquinone biosynthesis C-methylase UbiE
MALSKKTYKWFYDNVQSRYYNLLMKYCFMPFGGEVKCRAELIESVAFSENEEILDMCCGTGGATLAIARKAAASCRIIGMDLSSGQIRAARERTGFSNVEFVEGDACTTGFEDGRFDKVFITHALHEMWRADRLQVLCEARRILRAGGKVVILELDNPESFIVRFLAGLWFFYWLPFNFETPTRRDMLKHGLVNEVIEAGFRNVIKTSKRRGVFQIVEGDR